MIGTRATIVPSTSSYSQLKLQPNPTIKEGHWIVILLNHQQLPICSRHFCVSGPTASWASSSARFALSSIGICPSKSICYLQLPPPPPLPLRPPFFFLPPLPFAMTFSSYWGASHWSNTGCYQRLPQRRSIALLRGVQRHALCLVKRNGFAYLSQRLIRWIGP